MDKFRLLTGSEIVNIATTKIDLSLPETGVKDITPNGSWLEQKQIQAALEARKGLVEVERIVKSGSLSHAEWREDLMLAEVTQKVGGYWQYVGHNIGRQLFLYPEEALYLMESNCLLLRCNGVTVSMQQAYALLLSGQKTILHYRVYSFFSRLGYKVLRHKKPSNNNCKHSATDNIINEEKYDNRVNYEDTTNNCDLKITTQKISTTIKSDIIGNGSQDISSDHCNGTEVLNDNQNVLQKTNYSRIFKVCDIKHKHKYFNNIPDISKRETITLKTPDKQYIPHNTIVNSTSYTVNLEHIKNKYGSRFSVEPRSYSMTDEVNGAHVRRIRCHSADLMTCNAAANHRNTQQFQNNRVPYRNSHFRPFNFWRVPPNFNYLQFRLLFQRPFVQNFFPRFQLFPRLYPSFITNTNSNNYYTDDIGNSRKRTRDLAKTHHLEAIKNLATRLRMFLFSGNAQQDNVDSLHRLINTFNVRYKTNVHLNEHLELIGETITETIELEDDDASKSKKPRLKETSDCYNENISKLKKLSYKLKYLEAKGLACATHRRALSNAVKTFNKSYNSDIYVNHNYEIIDRRFITLDSSDSDCVVEETSLEKSKKLWNPFSGLKIILNNQPSTSKTGDIENNENLYDYNKYYEWISKIFDRNWLPSKMDFGRPEVVSKNHVDIRLLDTIKESLLYEFLKNQECEYNDWHEVKTAFFQSLEFTSKIQKEAGEHSPLSNCLLKPEDYTSMHTVLEKLSVIKTEMELATESCLNIDFDVYKDVSNFKKTNLSNPQFRIVCLCESNGIPKGIDIATLHSKYEDGVTIIFAIVGIDSISYLQMNSTELPIYIPSNVA